jgi:translin
MEEYSEAQILYTLNETGAYPRPEDVGVSTRVYLMGLADVPGELRRQALDALRRGEMSLAEERLETMEEIYLNLVSMVEAPMLRGLRRKMDIARGVIERTRSEVTAEAGRRRLDESVRRLSERLL